MIPQPRDTVEWTPAPVTALEPDPRRAASVRVHLGGTLGGAHYCTIAREAAEGLGLRAGLVVDDALRARLDHAADVEAAYRTVLRSLELRPYAREELARRLVRKGHPREAVEVAVGRAAAQGLLDDAAYALSYVQTRAGRGRGPARVRRDLQAKGVDRRLIDAAIDEQWPDSEGTADAALALATRRAAQLGDLPRPVKRRRLIAYLARRGFGGYEVGEIVSRVLDAGADDDGM